MADPFAPASLHERLSRVAQACPDGIAVEDERGSLTFAEFWNAAAGLALELTSGPAGSILLSMDKSVEGVVAYWAAFLAGRPPGAPRWHARWRRAASWSPPRARPDPTRPMGRRRSDRTR